VASQPRGGGGGRRGECCAALRCALDANAARCKATAPMQAMLQVLPDALMLSGRSRRAQQ
jgi:hypothetical protein